MKTQIRYNIINRNWLKRKKQNTNVSTSEREVYHWGGVFVLASADGRVLYSGPESWKYR